MIDLQKAIKNTANKKLEDDINLDLEMRRQVIAEAYERSEKYTNIIILAGYAGIFSMWSLIKNYLDKDIVLISALMIGVSLTTFIIWEVFKMFVSAAQCKKISEILYQNKKPSLIQKDLQDFSVKVRNLNNRIHSFWWIIVLIITILFGFGGGLLMLLDCFFQVYF